MANKFFFFILFTCSFIVWESCSVSKKSSHDGLSVTDCLPERKNLELIKNDKGMIQLIADEYVMFSDKNQARFFACNLPESYKKDGIKILFSVQTKEIFSHERLIAIPAYLTKIEQLN